MMVMMYFYYCFNTLCVYFCLYHANHFMKYTKQKENGPPYLPL